MKKILMIGTGGTIASEMSASGLAPGLSSAQLLSFIPSIKNICDVDCIQICSLDSTNIGPEHWLLMADTVRKNYDKYDGFVISHGTDTMAYTSAALSYLIQNSPKPIIITGSQKPINSENTDSKINLEDSFLCAASGCFCGVQVVFNGKVIVGTHARKTKSKSFQAFSSIDYPYLGVINNGQLRLYMHRKYDNAYPTFFDKINPNVALMKLIPGVKADFLEYLLQKNDAVIIESFGVGGIPSLDGNDFYTVIKNGIENGKTVVVTTQVANEGSDLSVYDVGNRFKANLNILEPFDMTTETVVAKLMWILGQTSDPEQIKKMFYTTIGCDTLYNQSGI